MKALLTAWIALPIAMMADKPNAIPPRLTIRVYNLAGLANRDLARSFQQTARVFHAAGINLDWSAGDTAAPEAHLLDMTVNREATIDTVPRTVVVRFVHKADPNYTPDTLGRALPDAQSGAHVTVFLNHVVRAQQERDLDLPTLLGYVVAHEVGHVLLGSKRGSHSGRGLMGSEWSGVEYRQIACGAMRFTRQEAAAMRAALASSGEGR